MQRFGAFGQCRFAARPLTQLRSVAPTTAAVLRTSAISQRPFTASNFYLSKPKGSLGVNPNQYEEPTDLARKLFSEFAFAFDIDGVLYQGRNRVDGAEKVIKMLRSNGIRYVFLTNGGCVPEDKKAETLQERLQIAKNDDVVKGRMILSHTPMSGWSDDVKNNGTVLITGSHPEKARQIALGYGFKRVVTPADILAECKDVFPFEHIEGEINGKPTPLPDGKRIPLLKDPYTTNVPANALKIDHIFIWNDPRDWSVDIQIIHDLLISHQGYIGTVSNRNGNESLPNNGWQQDGQPGLWVSNLDMLWKTNYPVNRFGTGAFMEALKGVWSTTTNGTELQFSALGKPSNHTYKYAHDRLLQYYHDMACNRGQSPGHDTSKCHPLRRVYMIGDNPESDIRGASEFEAEDGTVWVPILVRTGVWRRTSTEKEPRYKPAVIVDDVVDAVVWALNNEGIKATREWVLSALSHTKGYVKLPPLEIGDQVGGLEDGVKYPTNSLAEAHSSLYNALRIPQTGDINCFAGRETQSQCLHTLPKRRRALIKPIVQALAIQESNDEDQKATIDPPLRDLAKKLVCHRPEKIHTETLVFDGDNFSNPVDYAHALLARRFYNWLKKKSKESVYTEHPSLVQYSQKLSTSLREREVASTSKRTSDQNQSSVIYDTDDGEHSDDYVGDDIIESVEEDEEKGEHSRQISTTPELRRPRLSRESPVSGREIPRTPPRNHGLGHRDIYSQSPGPLLYPTPTDDEFFTSPGSVASPDPSEIFTPYLTASTALTPYSTFSTEGCETPRSSFRQSSYDEWHMESPTRKKMQTDVDLLSSDMMMKMKLNVVDLVNQSEEAESDAESLRSRRSMTFDDTEKSPVHDIISRLVKPAKAKSLRPGYIYCFAERSKPGFLKIGSVICPEFSKPDKVERRIEEWKRDCKHDLDYKFKVFMPCAVQKMEKLIHQTLHREKKKASCPNTACKKKHQEWFKITEYEARQIIEIWQKFSRMDPYDKERGVLGDHWARYELTQLDDDCLWNTKKWLATEWFKLITEAVEASMHEKLKALEQQLEEMGQQLAVLRKAQERLSM
ncbi:cat eye syndrome critical region 5 precursor [Fusarium acutatum]|uniref:Cat eye syndrome critical region 5 n=1 Tax=Fusarium acutatum TaxID=78861 RepID=A0A8H4K581_9HYPO|nr:cat eye syndrome critical region 5 precursor [Fusarium acutatum]